MLDHARAIQEAARLLRLRARLDLIDFRLAVQGRNRYFDLTPQFAVVHDCAIRSLPEIEGASDFLGWLPGPRRQATACTDKLAFKALCAAKGLATPPYWLRPDASTRDFIVKSRRPASGQSIRGPFRTHEAKAPGRHVLDDEYCERFMTGTMARVWYWDERPACLEMRAMPTVTGDGSRPLRELVAERMKGSTRMLPAECVDALASYQGSAPDEAVPAGKRMIGDFRYVSMWVRTPPRDVLAEHAQTGVGRQLADAGRAIWSDIVREAGASTLWTLDAIVEEDTERVWLLEANCRPLVHPGAYAAMLEGLFGPVESLPETTPAAQAGAAPAPLPHGLPGAPLTAPVGARSPASRTPAV